MTLRSGQFWSALLLALSLGVTACQEPPPAPPRAERPDLSFTDFTLRQANPTGKPTWELRTPRIVYNNDKSAAQLTKPLGFLFDETGKVLYEIQGDRGSIEGENADVIRINGNVVARQMQEPGAVLKGEELEWRPNQQTFDLRRNVIGTYRDAVLKANEGRFDVRQQQLELIGPIVATLKQGDILSELKTQSPRWLLAEKRLLAPNPLQAERRDRNQLKGQGRSQRGELLLDPQILILQQQVELDALDPVAQLRGDDLRWNLPQNLVDSPIAVQGYYPAEQTTVRGDRGQANLNAQLIQLEGNAESFSAKDQARLQANRLIWNQKTAEATAIGGARYQRSRLSL
ncbi:LPS export ABC transporter periplasmic protein LptC [Synechococcus elongatus]|uniref:LPS export ABC transporter periplasmic protein LptC n=2 Tax=Synechococcus elongatus TaxID=32046 RepID=A0AAN1QND3_SYNEL|nr:LPS export ABC transporter periplasmic protein LptC [Synechococcus elongatus]AZB72489.1 LPS export ABC transporter periplasmic protein LptC [Synechococcus elongatus PCC 11801]QFZ92212.1 LPS export ABC transporter periplasmic protein LptC [Synechococcus elongatus PCC 11802]